ncbi:MAG: hypothetical protein ACFFD2_02265 [Promethearchaeota archaeon]
MLTYELPRRHLYIRCGVLIYVDFLPAGATGSQIADSLDPPSTGVMYLAGLFLSHEDTLYDPLEVLVHGKSIKRGDQFSDQLYPESGEPIFEFYDSCFNRMRLAISE